MLIHKLIINVEQTKKIIFGELFLKIIFIIGSCIIRVHMVDIPTTFYNNSCKLSFV